MKYLILSLIAFIGFTATTVAQTSQSTDGSDEKSNEILKKISADIKGLSSFYMEFNMKANNPSTGENSNQNGSGYVKGNKYYAELGDNIVISNGVKNWTVVKSEKVTYQSDVDDDDEDMITPKKLMTIWENGFKNKYNKETTLNGQKVHEIGLFPTDPRSVNYHTIVLYVDVATNSLQKAIMKTKDGGTMTYTITKFEKNKAVTDAQFVYNPKKFTGYQLIRD